MESFSRYKICQSTVELVTKTLKKVGKDVKTSKIVVLGVAYKGEIDDTRNSARIYVGISCCPQGILRLTMLRSVKNTHERLTVSYSTYAL